MKLLALLRLLLSATPLSATLLCAIVFSASLQAAPAGGHAPQALFDEISALDGKVFDAFNHCDAPGRLDEHAAYFSPGVEFYHDTGGVTWTRDAMIGNTRKNVCGHFTRELVPGTLEVYPVKDFGAISQGVHRFCQRDSGQCEGLAEFVMVWAYKDGKWLVTRVLSYGHRAAADAR